MPTVPNTAAFIYLDTAAVKSNCSKEKKRIDEHCKKKDKNKSSFAEKLLGKKGVEKLNKIKEKLEKQGDVAEWVGEHCDGLWFKPVSPGEDGDHHIAEIANEIKGLTPGKVMQEVQRHADEMVATLEKVIAGVAVDAAEKAAVKRAAAWGLGALGGPIGELIATAYNIVDTVVSAIELKDVLGAMKGELEGLKGVIKSLPQKLGEIIKDAESNPQKAVADIMTLLSRLDGCLRARRCQLVPMKETHLGASSNPLKGKGCCPGQTGHHLLPEAMFKNCPAYTDKGSNSSHQSAPTICVEGVNNSHGSHGLMHGALEALMKKYPGGKIPLDKAIDEGVESVHMVFPESACSEKCLKAQLKAFYKQFENCSPLEANDGKGGGGGNGDKGGAKV
ncbi:hypothetical protein G7047_13240 [Diaphorobacter sp. HDW4A]|uniref:HNH/endonuclease VII fold toxin-2 domain-containing protein n=1 Tax=Diaphorobacter sp. HDW4A TaxID=2714924 RepID=UPI00140DACF1|nr:HNH/endonuclease VII fold toxin-2 domain-containing protein [Diaphorobacter sp. HDW4A]QIL80760.1 hypothetical protein G7047_13240 [Diaphorobacter sp. HDW4A]